MDNSKVASVLYEIADLLDIKGEIFFKTRAYRMAAQKIDTLDENIEDIIDEGKLTEIEGIGKAISKKITELVKTGKLEYFEKLKKEIPEALLEMLKIPGMGPKKVSVLYKKLNITSIDQLKKAASNGKLRDLDNFGEITEKNILRGIKMKEKTSGRVLLNVAYEDGNNYLDYLKKCKKIIRLNLAGSLRRRKETIGDLDILASSDDPDFVMDYFVDYDNVKTVLLKGKTKTSVILKDNLQVDLRVVSDDSFGSALQYFTGSKEHNVKMRSIAIKNGYKLNEYGLFKKDTDQYIVGKNEIDIYKKLNLFFIEPELRENRGEIQKARKNKLPKLIEYDDIKGDMHVHSNYSDGSESIEDMVNRAKSIGYKYIGIADHSQSLKIAKGLSEDRIKKKIKEIEKLNKKISDIHIFVGTECDIKKDGKLDYSNKILKMFDYVAIGIHTNFKMDKKEVTSRIIKGMENEHATFLVHPTCRLIGFREPFDIDFDKIFEKAKETDTYMEINSFPDRLDLNDFHTKIAKERGIKIVINTDAHNTEHLDYIKYGISTARRGWLEKNDVINTKSLKEIKKILGM